MKRRLRRLSVTLSAVLTGEPAEESASTAGGKPALEPEPTNLGAVESEVPDFITGKSWKYVAPAAEPEPDPEPNPSQASSSPSSPSSSGLLPAAWEPQ